MQKYTIRDFERDFPTDDACLDWLRAYLYPEGIFCKACEQVTKHYRVRSRPSYSCERCGHHEHPTAGTIFQDSRTPLRLWFHGVFLMASTRCGISAKQLERELGVTYKTAWRMFNRIRSLLNEDSVPASGSVEIDETYIGGRRHGKNRREAARGRMENKVTVLGIVQRGGRIKATKVPDASHGSILPLVQEHVLPRTMIYTDEHKTYRRLHFMGYAHRRIHHASKVYVKGSVQVTSRQVV